MRETPLKRKPYKWILKPCKWKKVPIKQISKKQAKRNQNLCKIKKSLPQFCSSCGSTFNLELHHKRKRSLCGGDDLSNLQILCHTCHSKIV